MSIRYDDVSRVSRRYHDAVYPYERLVTRWIDSKHPTKVIFSARTLTKRLSEKERQYDVMSRNLSSAAYGITVYHTVSRTNSLQAA